MGITDRDRDRCPLSGGKQDEKQGEEGDRQRSLWGCGKGEEWADDAQMGLTTERLDHDKLAAGGDCDDLARNSRFAAKQVE